MSAIQRSRLRPNRYYLTLARGERIRCLRVRPAALYGAGAAFIVLLALDAAGALSLAQGGLPSIAMTARQAEIEADYDDRLAAMREQMDIAARASAQQAESVAQQMRELAQHQRTLDARTDAIDRIAQESGLTIVGESQALPASGAAGAPVNPQGPVAAAPIASTAAALEPAPAAPAKPHPEGVELRLDQNRSSALEPEDLGQSLSLRLASLNADANRMQAEQLASVSALATAAARSAARIRGALAEAGLSASRLVSSTRPPQAEEDVGGPYVPVRLDLEGSPLETEFDRLQDQVVEDQKLASALPYLPLRSPLPGRLNLTSPFGLRVDPFLGRLALHPGADLKAVMGEAVMATAGGKVTNASYDGGYGNMVEIDHGDGLSTRYGHLSAILVKVGETVAAGQIIGRVGTTGRSTGPHLHYEVRIDGQAVDPMRFVRAGESLVASR